MYFKRDISSRIVSPRSIGQFIKDRLAFPLLIFLSSEQSYHFKLTPIDEERFRYTFKYITGRLLDIGCGENALVKTYKNGFGVDIYPWKDVDIIADVSSGLPFKNASFDTVSILASLNHIPNRQKMLLEAFRVLRPRGRILITMINPSTSILSHIIRYRFDPDQSERGRKKGEVFGLWKRQVIKLLKNANFKHIESKSFLWGLNRLYIGYK